MLDEKQLGLILERFQINLADTFVNKKEVKDLIDEASKVFIIRLAETFKNQLTAVVEPFQELEYKTALKELELIKKQFELTDSINKKTIEELTKDSNYLSAILEEASKTFFGYRALKKARLKLSTKQKEKTNDTPN